MNPNVGVGWFEGLERTFTTTLFALTLTYAPKPNVAWFVDTGGQSIEDVDGVASMLIDGGVAYIPGQNWQVDISAGWRLLGAHPLAGSSRLALRTATNDVTRGRIRACVTPFVSP